MKTHPFVRVGAGAALLGALVAAPAFADESDYYTHLLNNQRYAASQGQVQSPVTPQPAYVQPQPSYTYSAPAPQPVYSRPYNQTVSPATAYSSVPASGDLYELTVRHGMVVDGPSSIAVDHGTPVTIVVDTDQNDVVRLDGYGYTVTAAPGEPGMLRFSAERPGRFEYRSMRTGQVLGVLEVGPARLGSYQG